jgi:hypothetical protein
MLASILDAERVSADLDRAVVNGDVKVDQRPERDGPASGAEPAVTITLEFASFAFVIRRP